MCLVKPQSRLMLACCLFCGLNLAHSAPAPENPDMVNIMGQFIQSNYAMTKCAKPSPETLANYLKNFKMVTQRATQEMQKRQPDKTRQQIYAIFQSGTDNVQQAMDEVLKTKGCSDPSIQELLKLYEAHARIDFSHEPTH